MTAAHAVDVAELDARRLALADALDELAALSPDDAILAARLADLVAVDREGVVAALSSRTGAARLISAAAAEGGRRRRALRRAVAR